jgi:hypothetical protein
MSLVDAIALAIARSADAHPRHTSSSCPSARSPSSLSRRADEVVALAWAGLTLKLYNEGTTTFNAWCDTHGIPFGARLPANEDLLCEFAASYLRTHSGSLVKNYLQGIRAFHIYRNVPYCGSTRLKYVVRGVANAAPDSSKLDPRPPITLAMLMLLADDFSPSSAFDAACFAAATVSFWCQARLGELLPESSKSPFPSRHLSPRTLVRPLHHGARVSSTSRGQKSPSRGAQQLSCAASMAVQTLSLHWSGISS